MAGWRIRAFEEGDLDQAVRLWEGATAAGNDPIFHVGETVAAVLAQQPAFVAVMDGQLVGSLVTRISGDRAWIIRFAVTPEQRGRGIGSELLDTAGRALFERGIRHLSALLPEGEQGSEAFRRRGFQDRPGVTYFERSVAARPAEMSTLAELGGRYLDPGMWEQLKGMEREKGLIERRVILPLAQPVEAERHGVRPPRAIILFGPPGTGKTTFAKGVASRLGWPFVELFPSRLAAGGRDAQANSLRDYFAQVAELDRLVLFIDEVEEIAVSRDGQPATHGVTNELLKAIPLFREQSHHLLVCATNSVRSLDSAFIRPGRFDYLLPVGPPDEVARRAIWQKYVEGITAQQVDLEALVEATSLFTPADIEFAARKAAQLAFERALYEDPAHTAGTEDFLHAIREVRPTLDRGMIRQFQEDIEEYARY